MEMIDLADLSRCVARRWTPGIGDPSIVGWVTLAGYAAAAVLCLSAERARGRDGRFWTVVAMLMLVLAVNKQLDLHNALTATGRCLAQMQGWYRDRRAVQLAFTLGVLAAVAAILLIALVVLRRSLGRVGPALFGLALVLTYVALSAVGMHHVDRFFGITIGHARLYWILELSGIALIAVNAARARRPRPAGRRRR